MNNSGPGQCLDGRFLENSWCCWHGFGYRICLEMRGQFWAPPPCRQFTTRTLVVKCLYISKQSSYNRWGKKSCSSWTIQLKNLGQGELTFAWEQIIGFLQNSSAVTISRSTLYWALFKSLRLKKTWSLDAWLTGPPGTCNSKVSGLIPHLSFVRQRCLSGGLVCLQYPFWMATE